MVGSSSTYTPCVGCDGNCTVTCCDCYIRDGTTTRTVLIVDNLTIDYGFDDNYIITPTDYPPPQKKKKESPPPIDYKIPRLISKRLKSQTFIKPTKTPFKQFHSVIIGRSRDFSRK